MASWTRSPATWLSAWPWGPEVAPTPADAVESRLHDLGEFIREQRRRDRLSLRKLSELAGISNPYLSQIERGLRKPSAEILQAIAKGLRISAETLYVRAGILDEREEDEDLASRILADPTINERQKQALIDVYRSFQQDREPVVGADVSADSIA